MVMLRSWGSAEFDTSEAPAVPARVAAVGAGVEQAIATSNAIDAKLLAAVDLRRERARACAMGAGLEVLVMERLALLDRTVHLILPLPVGPVVRLLTVCRIDGLVAGLFEHHRVVLERDVVGAVLHDDA